MTTQAQRAHHVAQMRANFAIESMVPDRNDIILQERYVAGTVTIADMLAHARAFAQLAAQVPTGALRN